MLEYLISIQSVFLLFAFFLNLALSLTIYLKDRKNEVNRSFSAMLFGIAFWTGSLFAFLLVKNLNWILFVRRLTPIGSSILVGYFLYFSFLFPNRHVPLPRIQRYLMLAPGYVFSTFSILTPFMIKTIRVFTLGPIFSLILAGFIYYAIVKHKLLGVEVFLSRWLYFVSLLIIALGSVLVVLYEGPAFLPAFYLILTQIVLGAIILFKYSKSKLNTSFINRINVFFALFVFCCSVLSYFAYMVTSRNLSGLSFYDRYIFVVVSLLMSFFMYFSFIFPSPKREFSYVKRIFVFSFPVITLFFTTFNMLIKYVEVHNRIITPVFGGVYIVFVFFVLFYFLGSLYNLVTSYNASKGIEKNQIRYMFVGIGFAFGFLMITNFILPWFGYTHFAVFGPYSTLFFIGFTLYAIMKHRLMGVEIIIQKSIIYCFVGSIIMGIYALIIFISENFFEEEFGFITILISAVFALGIAVVFQPTISFLENFTGKFFLKGRYDYQKKIRTVSQEITTQIRLEDLTKLIISTFIDDMKVSVASLLLLDKAKKKFYAAPLDYMKTEKKYKNLEIDVNSSLAECLRTVKDVISLDELNDEIARKKTYYEEGELKLKSLLKLKEEIDKFGGTLWIPIMLKEELVGIIFLGDKISGDIYTVEDIELLTVLAGHVGIAIENTAIYEEVLSVKNYIQDILDAMVSGVLTVDVYGRIITFNPMAEKITKLSGKDIVDKDFKEVFSAKSAMRQTIEATLHNRCFSNFETSLVSSEGNLIPVSLNSTLLRNAQGRKTGVLIVLSDLTEVKILQDKARQADKVSALGTMAAGMAHEIKNPLSSMKVLAQLLPTKYDDLDFREKIIEIMPREINRVDRIVESLLGFARATSPKFIPLNLNQLIAQNIDAYKGQVSESKIDIVTNYGRIPQISGDPDQLMQAFSNFLLNAIQSMDAGGKLTISTTEGRRVENILETVRIAISDTGHGIPQDIIKKLFDPFFTTKYAGTGLGLTIAHCVIDSHRGTIDVVSTVGEGTTFIIDLPIKQESNM